MRQVLIPLYGITLELSLLVLDTELYRDHRPVPAVLAYHVNGLVLKITHALITERLFSYVKMILIQPDFNVSGVYLFDPIDAYSMPILVVLHSYTHIFFFLGQNMDPHHE